MAETDLWMLPYSTFMLMLVILFIVFYAMSSQYSVEYEAALADLASTSPNNPKAVQAKKEIDLARQLREFLKKRHLSDKAVVIISALFIKLKLESPTLFDSGGADLKPESLPLLEQMLANLTQMDNTVIVEGHTDNIPIHSPRFNSNWELSTARSFSVIRFFLNKGISPKRLVAHGFGEFRPIFSNDTEDGRARNRRIEITVVRAGHKL